MFSFLIFVSFSIRDLARNLLLLASDFSWVLVILDFYSFFTGLPEIEMMKERFAKLLLGEDMSGGGKGVCTALAISNAITNLSGNTSSVMM